MLIDRQKAEVINYVEKNFHQTERFGSTACPGFDRVLQEFIFQFVLKICLISKR